MNWVKMASVTATSVVLYSSSILVTCVVVLLSVMILSDYLQQGIVGTWEGGGGGGGIFVKTYYQVSLIGVQFILG